MTHFLSQTTLAEGTTLTDTSQTTVYTAIGGNMREILVAILVSNTTGTAATITLEWTDSSASATYSLVTGKSVAANDVYWLQEIGLPLAESDAIKATAGTGNALDVIVMVSELGRGGTPWH